MSLTLLDYERLMGQPVVRASIRRAQICAGGSYDEFVDQLYLDIDQLIYSMQSAPELRQDDSEDRLSGEILQGLRLLGYDAYPDGKTGGHVDMTVKMAAYSWLGEAKKDGNFDEGLLQLTTRYKTASGNFAHNQAGLVFYMVASPNAKSLLKGWSDKLATQNCSPVQCPNNVLAYFSAHIVDGAGTDLKVRTMGVSLYHKPKDKSARTSAKRKAAKAAAAGASTAASQGSATKGGAPGASKP
ncbi:MAG: hypothetical protein JF607_01205 [Burkholderiales bacterium]|nr:hypothetical protein [Burkholderiales bacterium]